MRNALAALGVLATAACGGVGRIADPTASSPEAAASLVPAPVWAGCGTPTVDGVLSPGEWDEAVKVRFAAALPAYTDGEGAIVPAEIQALSDDENLYVAFRLEKNTSAYAQSHAVAFDSDGSGGDSAGDDVILYSWAGGGESVWGLFADDYRWDCVVDGEPALCGTFDSDADPTTVPVGTVDGKAAIHFAEDFTTIELWHPYAGGDPRDVLRAAGELLPLQFSIRLLTACDVDVNDWPAAAHCVADTDFPAPTTGELFRPFLLGCGGPPPEQEVVEVRIEVKPGELLPAIRAGSKGSTAVAVLGSERFDVARVDLGSLFFAGAPVELASGGAPRAAIEDVDGDGIVDLVAHFPTSALQLEPGAAEASLAGRTLDGARFHGTDAVRVVAP